MLFRGHISRSHEGFRSLARHGAALFVVGLLGFGSLNAQSFTLTILHNNDGESQLVNAGEGLEDFGGVARFKAVADAAKATAATETDGHIMLSSGDNFLAGPEFNTSLKLPLLQPMYDAVAMDLIGYDAICIGNHDFDFGPDVLARFIAGFTNSQVPFLSANLGFSNEVALNTLKQAGRIAGRTVVEVNGQKIGVVGATTPQLSYISSPRNVTINANIAAVVQSEIDALTGQGINKIILISHLQSIREDSALAAQLTGVDVMIAGGGDELLANEGDLLIPGDENPFGSYPLVYKNAENKDVQVVTTPGDYRYLGRLVVEFDENGNVTGTGEGSGLIRVAGGDNPDAMQPNAAVQSQVVAPIESALQTLANNIIANSEVVLDGTRGSVRGKESNEGNLIADALLWQATELSSEFGTPVPHVALQNGGGIRNNNEVPAGDISELTTFSMVPFANFVSIVPQISAAHFKEILENAVSQAESGGGRFAQISGFRMVYDINGTAQLLDDEGNVSTAGTRVRSVILNDGTVIVKDGAVVNGAPAVNIATIDFLARGGDQYPYRGAEFTTLGVTYQQALANYISTGLESNISRNLYPEEGSVRIRQTVEFNATALPTSAPADNRREIYERNGVKVINGGFGSGMALDAITDGYFYLMTDRGPNFDAANGEDKVFPVPTFAPQLGLFTLVDGTLHKVGEITIKDADGRPISGLPNPLGQGGTGETATDLDGNVLSLDPEGLDPEGLVSMEDGTFWISDEYGPHILHVDAQGRTIERINPFGTGTGGRELPKVFGRRRPNRGMEGLTVTPDGEWLVGIMQSAMDNPPEDKSSIRSNSNLTRIVFFNIESGETRQYVYLQEKANLSNSEIRAVSATEFLVLERDGAFPPASGTATQIKRIYRININGATDISDETNSVTGIMVNGKTLEQLTVAELNGAGIKPVSKELAMDILVSFPDYPHDKPEGISLINDSTLAIINDDDFGIDSDGEGGIVAKILPRTNAVDANVIYFGKLTASTSGVSRTAGYSNGDQLWNAVPNPFSNETMLRYHLAKAANVELELYDVVGRKVTTIEHGRKQAGNYTAQLNASTLEPGTYVVRLRTDDTMLTNTIILVD